MTGPQEKPTTLDRIEENAGELDANADRFAADEPFLSVVLADGAANLRALVAVARAAQELAEVGNHTDTCDFVLETDTPLPCSCGRFGVLAALARLDGAR